MEQRCPSYLFIGVNILIVGTSLLAGSAGEPYTPGPESLTSSLARTGSQTGEIPVDAALPDRLRLQAYTRCNLNITQLEHICSYRNILI